jgi:hypothetical protein
MKLVGDDVLHKLFGSNSQSQPLRDFLRSAQPIQFPDEVCTVDDYYSTELDYDELGFQLNFTDAARFNNRERQFWGDDGVVLERIDFYKNRTGFNQFAGQLPFGLTWNDTTDTAHQKVFAHKPRQCRSYNRVVYAFEKFDACLTFLESRLVEVTCMATGTPLKPRWSCESPPAENLFLLLGRPIDQLFSLGEWGLLVKTQFDEHDEDDGHTLDLRYECGTEIYMNKTQSNHQGMPMIEAYKFYRDRELDATQWLGQLPFNLNWHTSPSQFSEISEEPALRSRDDEYDGYKLWKFEDSEFHIYYSNWINRASRITVGIPGFLC